MNKKIIAKTPPMGWNSWDCYGASVNEEQLLANAHYMAENLKEYGWEYVVCDIQWYEPLAGSHDYNSFGGLCVDEFSRVIPAENRFPSSAGGKGFKPIADEIHSLGLKFGIHIMRGIPRQAVHAETPIKCEGKTARDIAKTFSICPWNTDMYGVNCRLEGAQEYYNSIMELYASWGVDYIKVDDICRSFMRESNPYHAPDEIEAISKAIKNSGRDMVLSLSPGPAPIEMGWHLSRYANMWRVTDDFWDDWALLRDMFDRCRKWNTFVGEGHWPDCDMLPIGRIRVCTEFDGKWGRYTHFTHAEQITLMTLWSIFRSPLMIGAEMRDNDEFTLSLLTNPEIIDINQHSHSAEILVDDDNFKIWTCVCSDGRPAAALFNLSEEAMQINEDFSFIADGNTVVRDLWKRESIGTPQNVSLTLEPHGAAMIKFGD